MAALRPLPLLPRSARAYDRTPAQGAVLSCDRQMRVDGPCETQPMADDEHENPHFDPNDPEGQEHAFSDRGTFERVMSETIQRQLNREDVIMLHWAMGLSLVAVALAATALVVAVIALL